MRLLYAVLALVASAVCGSAMAQPAPLQVTLAPSSAPLGSKPGIMTPLGYCQLSVSNSAVLLSSCSGGIPSGATIAIVAVESNAVRWRDDGTAPTASIGMPIAAGWGLQYSASLSALQFIAQTGTATVDVWFGH